MIVDSLSSQGCLSLVKFENGKNPTELDFFKFPAFEFEDEKNNVLHSLKCVDKFNRMICGLNKVIWIFLVGMETPKIIMVRTIQIDLTSVDNFEFFGSTFIFCSIRDRYLIEFELEYGDIEDEESN